jgi:hypothetical protein
LFFLLQDVGSRGSKPHNLCGPTRGVKLIAVQCYDSRPVKVLLRIAALYFFANTWVFGQAITIDYEAVRQTKVVTALRITEKITIDGHLEEPAWKQALPAKDFIQQRPRNGEPADEQTEVRYLYDDDNLYIGAICFDSDMAHSVVHELKEDFNFGQSDLLNIHFDTLHDRRSALSFGVNAAGARRDQQLANDGELSNPDWDAVWDVKVSKNNESWIAEFVIPFKTLRFSKEPVQVWGVNTTRYVLRTNSESSWSPVPLRYRTSRVSQFGTLVGLENIRQGRNLKVKPFVTAGITQVRRGTELKTLQSMSRLKDYDGGVDAKYSLTSSLTLDATYRTDFAQVEVDQQQVNLTRFNLFFPEKRDFFLENSGTFSFGPEANLVPFFSRRIGLSSAGTPIPIVGGGRLTGKINRYDVGFLSMNTERFTEGAVSTPRNNYSVARVKRNLLKNSWVGGLLTSRDSTVAGDYNRVYGTDAHFQFYDKLEFDSFLLRSDSPGKQGSNLARRFESGWKDDEHTIVMEYNSVQPNFNPEVGFIRRRDVENYSGELGWRPLFRKSRTVRSLTFSTNFDYFGGSSSGKVETRTQDVTTGIQFWSGGSINFTRTQTFDRLINPLRIPSGNPHVALLAGDYRYGDYKVSFNTGQSRAIGGNGSLSWGDFYGGRRKALTGVLNLRPNYHLNVNLNYDRNQVTLPQGAFTTNLVGTRFTYAFTPRSFLNAFIQYNADTHQVSSNIRFDLTHHPLSDLYLVYNDRRDTISGQLLERAFIVKLTNLFNF